MNDLRLAVSWPLRGFVFTQPACLWTSNMTHIIYPTAHLSVRKKSCQSSTPVFQLLIWVLSGIPWKPEMCILSLLTVKAAGWGAAAPLNLHPWFSGSSGLACITNKLISISLTLFSHSSTVTVRLSVLQTVRLLGVSTQQSISKTATCTTSPHASDVDFQPGGRRKGENGKTERVEKGGSRWCTLILFILLAVRRSAAALFQWFVLEPVTISKIQQRGLQMPWMGRGTREAAFSVEMLQECWELNAFAETDEAELIKLKMQIAS